jgi:hypothetical protein
MIIHGCVVSGLVGVPVMSPLDDIASLCGSAPFVYSQR